jgi:predicted transcriptional regulator
MITLQLDHANEEQLTELAKLHGRDASQLATRIIQAYLDAKGWSNDSEAQWAEASVALSTEIFSEEDWIGGESANGSK